MPAAEVDIQVETEQDRVERWRAEELERNGYDQDVGPRARLADGRRPPLRDRARPRRLPDRDGAPHPALRKLLKQRSAAMGRIGPADGLLGYIPSPHAAGFHIGPLVDPHVRRDAAGRDPRVRLADGAALAGASAETSTSSSASRSGASRSASIGARAYHDLTSWSEVPAPEVEGRLRGLEGRPRRLGRDPLRRGRGRDRRPHARRTRCALFMDAAAPGLLLAQGDRPDRQLVEPGALRQARPSCPGGSRSTTRTCRALGRRVPAGRVQRHALPADVPLRADLGLAGVFILIWIGTALDDQAAGALRALRLLLLLRAVLRGAAADRPVAPHRRSAPERVGLDLLLHRLDRLLHLVAGARPRLRSAADTKAEAEAEDARTIPKGPKMDDPERPRPLATLACLRAGVRRTSWSSTSTRSRARSTCC